ncbi:unnamed protein product, partial [Closterium sp. NIES-54]
MSLWRQPQQQQWQRQQHRWPQLQQWRVQLQRLQQPPQRGPDGSGQYTHRYMGAATAIEPCVSSLAFVAGSRATSPTAWLSFTLDSRASSCFFRDCTDLTPLHTPVTIALADPSVGSVVADSTTTLPCLPESLAPLPRSPAPPCTPCIEDRQCAAPHSSSFPPTTAPLETLHLDAWGPSPVLGPCQERYFLIVVDDYSRYTTVLSLRRKADVPTVLEPWLLARGDVHGLFRYAAHQPNLWPSDERPRLTSILLWTGFPGVAADYRVWGCLAHVRAPGVNKLSARTRACVFLGFPLDASGWVFHDPVTHQFFAYEDVTFN